jgi:hypothetical protein
MNNFYKERIYKEIFEDIICLQFSNKLNIPNGVQFHIISFLHVDDIINMLLKERKVIQHNNATITIGKIKNFWYTNHDIFRRMYHIKNSWDIFKTCYNCNYCIPLHHNYLNQPSIEEYRGGFHLTTKINNKFTYLCFHCVNELK